MKKIEELRSRERKDKPLKPSLGYARRSHARPRQVGGSDVENIVLAREEAGKSRPPEDPRLKLLRQAFPDQPDYVRAYGHAVGLFGGKPKDLRDIAKIMKKPQAEVLGIVKEVRDVLANARK